MGTISVTLLSDLRSKRRSNYDKSVTNFLR